MPRMDINQAVTVIEQFLAQYRGAHKPVESKVNPSGDERDAIKVWLNFGPHATEKELPALEKELQDALLAAHPELAGITLRVRSQAF